MNVTSGTKEHDQLNTHICVVSTLRANAVVFTFLGPFCTFLLFPYFSVTFGRFLTFWKNF